MIPCVTLTQEDMVVLFQKWNEDAAAGNWHENEPNAEEQAAYFFKKAEELEAGKG